MQALIRKSYIVTKLDTAPTRGNREIYNYMWGPSEFTATGTLTDYDITHRLNEIKIPVLFTTGEFDEARPATVQYFQSLVPNSKFFIIQEAGHATMHDNPQQSIHVLQEFLEEIEN